MVYNFFLFLEIGVIPLVRGMAGLFRRLSPPESKTVKIMIYQRVNSL